MIPCRWSSTAARSRPRPAATRSCPRARDEVRARWSALDVLLVTGDAYVDHPSFGAAVIGRVLEAAGYKVGIVAQPDWRSTADVLRMGRPRLFVGITGRDGLDGEPLHRAQAAALRRRVHAGRGGGATAGSRGDGVRAALPRGVRAGDAHRARRDRGLAPEDRALRLLGRPSCRPCSCLRRGSARVRARREAGSGDRAPARLRRGHLQPRGRRGHGVAVPDLALAMLEGASGRSWSPAYDEIALDRRRYAEFSRLYHLEHNGENAACSCSGTAAGANRFVVVNPPMAPRPRSHRIAELPYVREAHPTAARTSRAGADPLVDPDPARLRGGLRVLLHHRAPGARHREPLGGERPARAATLASQESFRGTITDVGGATANMWGMRCTDEEAHAACRRASCVHPTVCKFFAVDHGPLVELYEKARKVKA